MEESKAAGAAGDSPAAEEVAAYTRGMRELAAGRPDEALAAFDEVLRLDATSHDARLARCRALMLCGCAEEAVGELKLLAEELPDRAAVHGCLGEALLRRQQLEAAEAALRRACELDDSEASAPIAINLGSCLFKAGSKRWAEAEQWYAWAEERAPGKGKAMLLQLRKARAELPSDVFGLIATGRTEEALAALAGAADCGGKDEEGRTALHWAVDRGEKEVVQALLAAGADVAAADDEGLTPLAYAAMCGEEDIARLLLAAGAIAGETELAEADCEAMRTLLRGD
eukprot:PLAT2664.1.p2 GENE.PLAT2664.1~~PLAT2664.1.p2  ORF type:complete len:285 (-),score=172.17 PLAT2664.1:48-902(-)